jgi:hypothetical protein
MLEPVVDFHYVEQDPCGFAQQERYENRQGIDATYRCDGVDDQGDDRRPFSAGQH